MPEPAARLRPLFAPRSVAVVGASTKESTFSHQMVKAMALQLDGIELAVVNPRATTVAGVPAAPTLTDLGTPPELVVVVAPAAVVPDVLDEAIGLGTGAAIVLSSGFGEIGGEGAALQTRLAAQAEHLAILGPNCQGMMYRPSGLMATFTPSIRGVELPAPSPIGYVGQSGALGGAFGDAIRERGVAPATWVSTGNQVDVDVVAAAQHIVTEGHVEHLFMYLEQTPDGAAWSHLCASAQAGGCALTVLRSGTSEIGQAAVASHTGALVGDDRGFAAVSREHGVRLVEDIDQLVGRALVAGHRRGRSSTSSGVAVLSSSGGAGAIAADQADRLGVVLTDLAPATTAALVPLLPAFASARNPIDVTAQLFTSGTAELGQACAVLAEDPDVGHILIVLSLILDPGAGDLARDLVATAAGLDVPVSVVYLASRDRTPEARAILAAGGVAVFDSIGAAMDALAGGHEEDDGAAPTVAPAGATVAVAHRTVTLAHGGGPLLEAVGIPTPTALVVAAPEEAAAAVRQLGGTAVLKLDIDGVAHKSELGAVRLGVTADRAEVVHAELTAVAAAAGGDGVVVAYPVADDGVELVVSARAGTDGFPPTITVGWGGTLVELYDDVTTFTTGLDRARVERELRQLRCWRLLAGWRGADPADVPALLDALAALAGFLDAGPDGLVELEVNPLRVHRQGKGVTALDLHATFADGA